MQALVQWMQKHARVLTTPSTPEGQVAGPSLPEQVEELHSAESAATEAQYWPVRLNPPLAFERQEVLHGPRHTSVVARRMSHQQACQLCWRKGRAACEAHGGAEGRECTDWRHWVAFWKTGWPEMAFRVSASVQACESMVVLGSGGAQAGSSRLAGRCCGPSGPAAGLVACTCCGP